MIAGPFNATRREGILEECRNRPLDLAVIGGGITGAGILRDAALRGLRAALFEKNDFAWGSSGRSSKLIHGGIRYLETKEFRLIFEGLKERHLLLKLAPHLVKPLSFLFPVYKGQRRQLQTVAAGVFLYHLLSLFRNVDRPRLFLKNRILNIEPMLRAEGLQGAVMYFDAVTNDAALTVATIGSAWERGGLAVNHAEVIGFLEEKNQTAGVRVLDRIGGKTFDVRSRWTVNATGPWSDLLRSKIGLGPSELRPTKGIHLVLDRSRLRIQNAIVMLSPADERVTFCIPWQGFILVGTTDTDYSGNPDQAEADETDVRYLLNCVNHYFPLARLTPSNVQSTFAGVRPLLRGKRKDATHPSQLSRDHKILSERRGFVTIAGGKLTSFRKMGEEVVDWILRSTPDWRVRTPEHPTRFMPYPRREIPATEADLLPGIGIKWSDMVRAADHEMAATIEDVLCRRTAFNLLDRRHGADLVHRVANLLSERLGLSKAEVSKQIVEYNEAIHRAEKGLGRNPA